MKKNKKQTVLIKLDSKVYEFEFPYEEKDGKVSEIIINGTMIFKKKKPKPPNSSKAFHLKPVYENGKIVKYVPVWEDAE